ncbi:DUF202 domain-containing protein [Parvularcula sp. ZS-1/3]|uniref:DUF202 domain-containing protein n=1 Tax=Parvularcula mediterranea TaxID=2732508 RepID=A0A7Y3RNL1_9PROT|nr:DUF202 domain-containing protein [Parvularcula mediterranea]NNU16920.1 DUF202 domain-containing protein [Parvularcula mediterranea]
MAQEKSSADKRTELAEDRTDWAEDRTMLAAERTFAAWARTAMAASVLGLGFNALVRTFEPQWVAKAGASLFLLIAIGILQVSWRQACAMLDRLTSHAAEHMPPRHFRVIGHALSVGCALIIVMLWLIH